MFYVYFEGLLNYNVSFAFVELFPFSFLSHKDSALLDHLDIQIFYRENANS
jgi:hypothetical protein